MPRFNKRTTAGADDDHDSNLFVDLDADAEVPFIASEEQVYDNAGAPRAGFFTDAAERCMLPPPPPRL